jgi:lysophospholipase L1-like esterase
MNPLKSYNYLKNLRFESVPTPVVIVVVATMLLNSEQAAAMGKKPMPSQTQPNYMIAALGDSIAAGTLADTSVRLNKESETDISKNYASNIKAKFIYTNRYSLTWGTGDKIASHYMQLKSWLAKNEPEMNLVPLNVAVPGAMAEDLVEQAQAVVDAMASGQYRALKYVAIDIGANDACAKTTSEGTPDNVFTDNVRNIFSTLAKIKQDQPIRVIVSSIPKVPDLGRPDIQETKTLGGVACSWIRQHIFTYCRTLPIWSDADEYDHDVAVVEDKNAILQSVIDEVNRTYPNIQASFSYAIYDEAIDANLLALDCFHPNKEGQEMMATKLWADQPWFH